ncbi:transcriptional regulator SdiA [Pantoea sp. BAV 3049]|uniref:transcriptional regulator SdiA n=1 Tax=Pantoea sp. BAV 3049 TaxID=2654188 RepID=UPI00131C7F83|nr:transcriptional regulator SdiA [Pantoea sp. BAV 3049]
MTAENYFSWRNEMHSAFHQVTETADITRLIERQTIKLGLEFYALYVRHPVPFTRPGIFIYSNYPKKWVRTWQKENFAEIDPIIKYCQIPGTLLLWNDPIVTEGRRVFEAAKEHGIRAGFSYSMMVKNRAIGILSMASGKSFEKIALTQECHLRLQYLTDLTLEALQRVKDISMLVMNMDLTQRELEILKWTAEGKTSAEISLILSISENTVNFHQKNMQKRLNAPNKTQVASYAAAIGLL